MTIITPNVHLQQKQIRLHITQSARLSRCPITGGLFF